MNDQRNAIFETLSDGTQRVVATVENGVLRPVPPKPLAAGATLYKYLTKREWMRPWIEGGEIPIFPASTYRSMERRGIYTPDEVLQIQHYGGPPRIRELLGVGPGVRLFMDNCTVSDEGGTTPVPFHISMMGEENSLIECYCLESLRANRRRFRKESCVKIIDFAKLKKSLDDQLGCESIAGYINYTYGPNRSHFEKSMADQWQREFRLVWLNAGTEMRQVVLPPGVAIPVTPYEP